MAKNQKSSALDRLKQAAAGPTMGTSLQNLMKQASKATQSERQEASRDNSLANQIAKDKAAAEKAAAKNQWNVGSGRADFSGDRGGTSTGKGFGELDRVNEPTFIERVASTAAGAGKQYAANLGSALTGLYSLGTHTRETEAEKERADIERRLKLMEQGWKQQLAAGTVTEQEQAEYEQAVKAQQDKLNIIKTTQRAWAGTPGASLGAMEQLEQSAQRDIGKAKEGLGGVGKFVVDTGVAGSQMLMDAALGGGSAMIPMAGRVFGGGYQEATQEGATNGQALAYGAGSAAVSVLTEKLASVAAPFKKIYGGGWLDDAITKATGKLGASAPGRLALSAISEAGEEFLEALVQPVLQRATYDKDAQFDLSEALYSALIGATLGGFGSGVELIGNDLTPSVSADGADGSPARGEPSVRTTEDPKPVEIEQVKQDTPIQKDTDSILYEMAQEMTQKPQKTNFEQVGTDTARAQIVAEGTEQARSTTQREYNIRRMQEVATTLGENGAKTLNTIYDGKTRTDGFFGGFAAYYEAGVSGQDMGKVRNKYGTQLNEAQKFAAYTAGQNDAAASLAAEKRAAQFAQVAGESSGLVYDDYVRGTMDSAVADRVNSVAKLLGTRVRFVDSVRDGTANAQITGSEVLVEKNNPNPVMFLLGHEWTHRMQELAPTQYRAFREAVAAEVQGEAKVLLSQYRAQGESITYETALDEAAANYAGRMIEDGKVLNDFIEKHNDDRTMLEKVLEAIRDLVQKLTGAEKRLAQTAEGKLVAALESASQQVGKLSAQNAASRGTMEAERYSLKEDHYGGNDTEEAERGLGKHYPRAAQENRRTESESRGDGNVLSRWGMSQGQRPAHRWAEEGMTVPAAGSVAENEARTVCEEYGLPVFVVRDDVFDRNHTTAPAFASGGQVYLRATLPEIGHGDIGVHEAGHVMKQLGYQPYLDFLERVADMMNRRSDEGIMLLEGAAKHCGVDLFDCTDGEMLNVYDEISNMVMGAQHAQKRWVLGVARNAFHDFDSYVTELSDIHERFKQERSGARFSLKGSENARDMAALQKENDLLRERVDYWKGQTQRTRRVTTDKKAVTKATRELIRSYGATLETADINAELQSLYDYIASGYEGKDELTYTEARNRAESIARKLVEAAVTKDDDMYHQYGDLRTFLRDTKLTISEQESRDITDFGDFRKQNMGRMNLAKGKTNIGQVYEELSERWPEFFDSQRETNPVDQLTHIAEVLDGVYDITEYNPFSPYMEQAVADAANEVMEMFFDLPQTRATFADRQAQKLGELRAQNRQKVKQAIEKERQRRDTQVEKLKKRYREKSAAGRERRNARELRAKIIRHANALSKKLLRPNDKQHIPEKLRQATAAMLEAINQESTYELEFGKDAKYHRVKTGNTLGAEATKRTKAFRELRLAYAEITKEGSDYTLIIDPDLMDNLNELEAMKDTPLGEMGTAQLETIWATIKAVEGSIRTANKILGKSRFETISQFADGIRNDNIMRKDRGDFRGIVGWLDKKGNFDMLTPQGYFHRLGQTGEELFRMMRSAQDRHIEIIRQAQEATRNITGKADINKLERETHAFDLSGGKLTMSTAQIMSLYKLMQRKQAQDHILKGGIRPEAITPERGVREIHKAVPVRVNLEDLTTITGVLTEEQRRIADGLQKYMGGELAELGNTASMEVYGYRKFNEKDYFPIQVDKNQTQRDISKEAQAQTIAGRGFTKSVTPHANNAVMLNSIDEADYMLYKLALSMVDEPTKSGKFGSYTNDEVQMAIDMLTDLDDEARAYLWEAQGKSESSNPYK